MILKSRINAKTPGKQGTGRWRGKDSVKELAERGSSAKQPKTAPLRLRVGSDAFFQDKPGTLLPEHKKGRVSRPGPWGPNSVTGAADYWLLIL